MLELVDPETAEHTSLEKCCEVNDKDKVCTSPSRNCISSYSGPPSLIKNSYNLTHPRSSPSYDKLLNLFRCGWQTPYKNFCSQ